MGPCKIPPQPFCLSCIGLFFFADCIRDLMSCDPVRRLVGYSILQPEPMRTRLPWRKVFVASSSATAESRKKNVNALNDRSVSPVKKGGLTRDARTRSRIYGTASISSWHFTGDSVLHDLGLVHALRYVLTTVIARAQRSALWRLRSVMYTTQSNAPPATAGLLPPFIGAFKCHLC